jgi:hypothetical protein
MRFFFVWGFAAFVAFAIAAGLAFEWRRLPYIAWCYALLIAVRSVFIMLTPMQSPEGALPIVGSALFDAIGRQLTFGNDLFFSAHTALPFLGFLVFRGPVVRGVFLAFSILLAATVLLSRLHYSIDVAGAYFITYAVYKAEVRWFQRYYLRWKTRTFGTTAPAA